MSALLLLYVMVGAALGGGLRYVIGALWHQRFGPSPISWPTLLINVLGSLVIGFVLKHTSYATPVRDDVRAFVATGILGGFTTFSAFSYETVGLLINGDVKRACVYVGASVVLSLLACWLGMRLDLAIYG